MSTSELKFSPLAKVLGGLVLIMFTAICGGVVHLVWSNHKQSYDELQSRVEFRGRLEACLLYTSPSPRDS